MGTSHDGNERCSRGRDISISAVLPMTGPQTACATDLRVRDREHGREQHRPDGAPALVWSNSPAARTHASRATRQGVCSACGILSPVDMLHRFEVKWRAPFGVTESSEPWPRRPPGRDGQHREGACAGAADASRLTRRLPSLSLYEPGVLGSSPATAHSLDDLSDFATPRTFPLTSPGDTTASRRQYHR